MSFWKQILSQNQERVQEKANVIYTSNPNNKKHCEIAQFRSTQYQEHKNTENKKEEFVPREAENSILQDFIGRERIESKSE